MAVAVSTNGVKRDELDIKQSTKYEQMVHRMAKTLFDYAQSDVKACILYENQKHIPNDKLLELLKQDNQTALGRDVFQHITQTTLRPFAGVRLRFI